jgi:hypothetical protein
MAASVRSVGMGYLVASNLAIPVVPVGHEVFPTGYVKIRRLLVPGGRATLAPLLFVHFRSPRRASYGTRIGYHARLDTGGAS